MIIRLELRGLDSLVVLYMLFMFVYESKTCRDISVLTISFVLCAMIVTGKWNFGNFMGNILLELMVIRDNFYVHRTIKASRITLCVLLSRMTARCTYRMAHKKMTFSVEGNNRVSI